MKYEYEAPSPAETNSGTFLALALCFQARNQKQQILSLEGK